MSVPEDQPACAKCGGPMEEGWMPEAVTLRAFVGWAVRVSRDAWMPGRPALTSDGFVQDGTIDWTKAERVIAHRCSECGYLELYARKDASGDLPVPARGGELGAESLPRAADRPE